ncbi:DUF4173 domain-containing protein [Paracoccus caeni]|uniref:DUF4173 domain-containing protein n=1 Tax=Paracoccus caeni TaxID=657651 RepID=A0A934SFU2_9RHOB|nr:DUF4173 domain-containing protein [Paracoccus caeni]MBK4214414.1 DUF4173 domain-containing protein [Paracoccus caeni]
MGQSLTLRGIPHSIQRDAWWLTDNRDPGQGSDADKRSRDRRLRLRLMSLVLLIALADLLFWRQRLGLSLPVYACAIFVLSVWNIRPITRLIGPAVLLIVSILPAVEHVQLLSVLFLCAGLTAAVVWATRDLSGLLPAWGAFLCDLPRQWALVLVSPIRFFQNRFASGATANPSWRTLLRNWAFPVGGGLIFAALLLDANPLLYRLFQFELPDLERVIRRGMFWSGLAIALWPLLSAEHSAPATAQPAKSRTAPNLGLNTGSVLRSLWLFNALIGVQTVLDLSILIGGAELPAGMTYAQYAHRGAYPLLLTALLAGIFALLARPFLAEHRALKPLMLLWLAQNIALCASALLRLDLYIDSFGLTYLRIYALIWMCLVATGLGLTAWQVQMGHGNGWLIRRVAVLALGTLYLTCFINFAQIIAEKNLSRHRDDNSYICSLGPMAFGAVVKADRSYLIDDEWCRVKAPEIDGWRDWGFRKWRVRSYGLDAIE